VDLPPLAKGHSNFDGFSGGAELNPLISVLFQDHIFAS
jgi:hypothetical protein